MSVSICPNRALLSVYPARKPSARARGSHVVLRAEEPRVTREYREDDDTVVSSSPDSKTPSGANPSSLYADELPEPPRSELSPEMKERLRREYYGLGGSPNRSMGGNYFLYISLIIAALAILSAALGYI